MSQNQNRSPIKGPCGPIKVRLKAFTAHKGPFGPTKGPFGPTKGPFGPIKGLYGLLRALAVRLKARRVQATAVFFWRRDQIVSPHPPFSASKHRVSGFSA